MAFGSLIVVGTITLAASRLKKCLAVSDPLETEYSSELIKILTPFLRDNVIIVGEK